MGYSIQESVQTGTWVPTWAGWSTDPTVTQATWYKIGKLCIIHVRCSSGGTSNATTATMTLPFTAANTVIQQIPIIVIDNGTTQAGMGVLQTAINSNVATLLRTTTSTAWTASGQKHWTGVLTYITT